MDKRGDAVPKKKINALCNDIENVLSVMSRANNSGDDVQKEIEAGLILLQPLVNELRTVCKPT